MKLEQKPFSVTGNCYEIAAKLVAETFGELVLCHGIVWHTKTGWHGHAWAERGNLVIDLSNNKIAMKRDLYYRIGKIRDVKRYDYQKTLKMMLKTKNFGPWEKDENG